jgi:hypothetical protein
LLEPHNPGFTTPRSSHTLGAVTGKWCLGRVIAYIVVFTQVALGAAVASLEARLPRRRTWLVPACTLSVILGLSAYDRPPLPHIIKAATDDARRAVISRCQVRWILLNRREVSPSPRLVLLSSCPTSAPEHGRPDAGPVNTGPRT